MTKTELKEKIEYLRNLVEEVPNGLSELKDAITLAMLDLGMAYRFEIQGKSYNKAIGFVNSIPVFEGFDSDECTSWMLHSTEYIEYFK